VLSELAGAIAHTAVALVRDILVEFFLFNIGRGALLACTLGRYPHGPALERDSERSSATGFGIVVLTGVVLAVYNNLFAVV
jgi:hypothetical protein